MEHPLEKLLTESQAAELLGLKTKTLSCWRWRKTGPAYIKLSGAVRYRLSDLEDYIDGATVHPRPAAEENDR